MLYKDSSTDEEVTDYYWCVYIFVQQYFSSHYLSRRCELSLQIVFIYFSCGFFSHNSTSLAYNMTTSLPVSRFEFTDGFSLKYGQVTCYWPISTHHRRVKVHATCVKLASNLTELRLSATAQSFVPTSNIQPFINIPISIICEHPLRLTWNLL